MMPPMGRTTPKGAATIATIKIAGKGFRLEHHIPSRCTPSVRQYQDHGHRKPTWGGVAAMPPCAAPRRRASLRRVVVPPHPLPLHARTPSSPLTSDPPCHRLQPRVWPARRSGRWDLVLLMAKLPPAMSLAPTRTISTQPSRSHLLSLAAAARAGPPRSLSQPLLGPDLLLQHPP